MKAPVRVTVTGPAGQIGYATLFRIASGAMFGPDQPVFLTLLERANPTSAAALKGVMMELSDCASRFWPACVPFRIPSRPSATARSRSSSAPVRAVPAWNAPTC